jgi:hypothetical protein
MCCSLVVRAVCERVVVQVDGAQNGVFSIDAVRCRAQELTGGRAAEHV